MGSVGSPVPGRFWESRLVEVDRVALREIPPPVDGIQRAAMRTVATTAQGGPTGARQRRAEHDRWPPIDFDRCPRVGQAGVGYGHAGRRIDGQLVFDRRRDCARAGERDVKPHDADRCRL